jgi:hypothetical protein
VAAGAIVTRRVLAYAWAAPASAAGLLLALLACVRGRIGVRTGVVEAEGPLLAWCLRRLVPIHGGVAAMTIGHVVIARDACALSNTRSHERVHVAQYERWGVFFFPAYALASLWAAARGRHFYLDNWFEREARAGEGGVLTECAGRWPRSSRRACER